MSKMEHIYECGPMILKQKWKLLTPNDISAFVMWKYSTFIWVCDEAGIGNILHCQPAIIIYNI